MNLFDIIPVHNHKLPAQTEYKEELGTATLLKNHLEQLSSFEEKFDDIPHGVLLAHRSYEEHISRLLDDARGELFNACGGLPEVFHEEDDALTLLSKSPRMKLNAVKGLADTLSFVVIPFDYLTPAAWEQDEQSDAIRSFVEVVEDKYDPYVLAPISLYDMKRHVEAEHSEMDIYASPDNRQALTAIQMVIPLFKSMQTEIRSLRTSVGTLSQSVSRLQDQVTTLSRRVEQLARETEENQRQLLLARAQNAEMQRRIERMETISARDPLLLAIPNGQLLQRKNVDCIVGPCWGPDFDNLVFTLLQLTKKQNQRKKLSEITEKWGELET